MAKLEKKIFFETTIEAVTGLHIGGSNLSMGIGGADAIVVRNALTNQPYIPGSSIKGKMRSLTERLLGKIGNKKMGNVKNGPFEEYEEGSPFNIIPMLYGMSSSSDDKNIPSRLIVRDGYMTEESASKLFNSEYTDMPYTEVKTEVVIDRVTSAAMPRQLERVPGGTSFHLKLVLNVHEGDDEQRLIDYVRVGLMLMEDDYLGGKGSRGNGEIKVNWADLKVTFKELKHYEQNLPADTINLNLSV